MNLPICIWDVNLREEKTIPFTTGNYTSGTDEQNND